MVVVEALQRWRSRPRTAVIRDYGIIVIFVALFITLASSSSAFLSKNNLLNILDQSAPIGVIACGATLVMIAGGFDLSVGAIFALAGISAAIVTNHIDPALGLITGVAFGLTLGIVNGIFVTTLRINSFIATLASGLVFRGIALLITGGFLITVSNESFQIIGRERFLSAKYTVYIFAGVILLTWFLLARTAFGRYIYAVGGNPEAARLSGIRVDVVRGVTFALSGLLAGLAGVMETSKIATAQPAAGTGIELAAIAAVVIGGTSIMGGEGAIWRSVLGILLLALIGNGFNILNVDPLYQSIVEGGIILVAVAVDAWSRRRAG
jgi:ribose transport system permease protein